MTGDRVVFLVNPASANGSTGRRWPAIRERATALGVDVETRMSERPGAIAELALRSARDGAPVVVAVGGDGTVNEAVDGLARFDGPRPALAVVPTGTGMDFVRTYGIPSGVEAALRVALGGATRVVDVGHVRYRATDGSSGERFFANVASAGMSGAVAKRANRTTKALGGRASFFLALVHEFARWRNVETAVELDGERVRARMTSVVVANGQYHAGGMWLAPGARPDDGLFDVLVFGDVTKLDFLLNVARIYRGTHLGHPKIALRRAASVAVDAERPLAIELDGEQPGTTPARFEIVPGALALRIPSKRA